MNDESPRKCSSKGKNLEKNSKTKKQKSHEYIFDDLSFEPAQIDEVNKKAIQEMEAFKKNVEYQKSVLLQQMESEK